MVDATVEAEYLYTNNEKVFTGSLRDFYASVWRCERLPLRLRLVAGRELFPTEPLPLPPSPKDMSDEQLRQALEEYKPERESYIRERDEQLRQLIEAGVLSEEVALKVRAIFVYDDCVPWVPMPARHDCDIPEKPKQI
jgi:hypothetical protein